MLDVLIPLFEKQTGYSVKTISVGTGQALALAAKGDADVALVHAPSLEKQYVAEGKLLNRRLVMYNDFVIIGPKEDPAQDRVRRRARSARSRRSSKPKPVSFRAATTRARISWKRRFGNRPALSRRAPGISRLARAWARLSASPTSATPTRSRTGELIWRSGKRVSLPILIEGDKALLNIYSVMEVNPANGPRINSAGGKAFADFMVAPQTQNVIAVSASRNSANRFSFRSPARKRTSSEFNVELIWQGILKADRAGLRFRCRGLGDHLALAQNLRGGDLDFSLARHSSRHRARSRSFSRPISHRRSGQYRHGFAAGGGRVCSCRSFFGAADRLGFLELIYSPSAMVLAQVIIALPIVAGLTMASFQSLDPKLSLQLLGIGASRAQLLWLLCKEARLPLLAAVMAGFGGVISEVGASMMVGGNIRGQTRVLTTATVLETGRGNFDVAIALSLILLTLTFAINFFLTRIQQREHLRWPRLS